MEKKPAAARFFRVMANKSDMYECKNIALNITRNHTEVTRKSHGFQVVEMIIDFFCLLLLLQVNDVSVQALGHKIWKFYLSIAAISLRVIFYHPGSVRVLNHRFGDFDFISGEIPICQGTDLTSPKRPKCRQENGDFQLFSLNVMQQRPNVVIIWAVKLWFLPLREGDPETQIWGEHGQSRFQETVGVAYCFG